MEKEKVSKISKGITKKLNGSVMEDRFLTVTGADLKEVAREFDKRWEKE